MRLFIMLGIVAVVLFFASRDYKCTRSAPPRPNLAPACDGGNNGSVRAATVRAYVSATEGLILGLNGGGLTAVNFVMAQVIRDTPSDNCIGSGPAIATGGGVANTGIDCGREADNTLPRFEGWAKLCVGRGRCVEVHGTNQVRLTPEAQAAGVTYQIAS